MSVYRALLTHNQIIQSSDRVFERLPSSRDHLLRVFEDSLCIADVGSICAGFLELSKNCFLVHGFLTVYGFFLVQSEVSSACYSRRSHLLTTPVLMVSWRSV